MKRYLKIGGAIIGALGLLFVSVAAQGDCGGSSSNQAEQGNQATQQDIYNQAQPLPHFPYSNYRQEMIEIETQLAVGKVVTWTTWETAFGNDKHVCKSLGWPIPVTTQLSNPLQAEWGSSSAVAVGQQDPIGVYPPPAGLGTWILCLDSNGVAHPVYTENNAQAYPWPVTLENDRFVEHPDQATAETAIHPCKYDAATKKCLPTQ